jgi:hypothetical protein
LQKGEGEARSGGALRGGRERRHSKEEWEE